MNSTVLFHRTKTISLAICGLVVLAEGALQAQEPQLRPLAIEDALSTLSLAGRMPIDLSPDGEWVAYTLQDASRRDSPGHPRYRFFSRTGAYQEAAACDVWLTNIQTQESRNLTGGQGTSWGPVWSPDGEQLAFFSDRGGTAHLWTWERATDTLREFPGVIPRPFFGFAVVRWTEDSKKVLLKVLPEGLTVETAADMLAPAEVSPEGHAGSHGVSATIFDATSPVSEASTSGVDRVAAEFAVRYLSDIAVVDVSTEAIQRVAREVRGVGYWISPDGEHVAYTTVTGVRANTQDVLYDLNLVSVAEGWTRALARDIHLIYGITVSWSPDGRMIAVATGDSQLGTPGEVYVTLVRRPEELRKVSRGEHPSISTSYRAPLWDANSEFLYFVSGSEVWRASVRGGAMEPVVAIGDHDVIDVLAPANNVGRMWSPDAGRSLIAVTVDRQTRESGFWQVDLETGLAAQVMEERKYYGRNFLYTADVSERTGTIVYAAESATTGEDLWITDASFGAPQRVTNFNPEIDEISLGDSQLISWQGLDGAILNGALFLPAGYEPGKLYPLIVRPYAGSMLSRNVFRFGGNGAGVDNLHILTTRGYAVLLPDVPQRVGTPMADIAGAVLPGIDRVVELGIADPDRLGVTGHSYGGYSTLALIVQTPRFKAAVSSAGPANLISAYGALRQGGSAGAIGWSETGQGRLGGHPWDFRDRYIDNSPIFFLDRVQTPLLMVHGGTDESVRPSQPEEVFVGLRRLGKPVAYVRYEGEGHWQGTWGRENVVDYWNRVIDWFDRYLR